MRRRILFGLILLVALAAVVLVDRALAAAWLGSAVVLFMTLVAQRELLRMLGSGGGWATLANLGTIALFAARVPVLGLDASAFLGVLVGAALALLVAGTFALQARGQAVRGEIVVGIQAGLTSLVYVALPLSFLVGLAWDLGTVVAGALVLASKCGDMGGYLVGSLIGRHKVMPEVSPNKSWQGSFGGAAMTIAVMVGLDLAWPGLFAGLDRPRLVVLALIINLATQLGDFAESMVKRCCDVKDSANLVPTFGGALDIVDSLIFAMPAAAFALRFLD